MRRQFELAFVVSVAFGVVVGAPCTSARASAGQPGYTRVEVDEAGISLLVPKNWHQVHATRKQAERAVAANPQSPFTVDQLLAVPFTATGRADADPHLVRGMSVQKDTVPRELLQHPRQWRDVSLRSGLSSPSVERTRVAGEPALLTTGNSSVRGADGSFRTVYVSIYSFAVGDKVIDVGFTRSASQDPEYDEMINVMVASIKRR